MAGSVAPAPAYGDGRVPLYLVASRPGSGREPWYLLTNEVVQTPEQAWKVVLAYARRWQIEMSFRFLKSELALESLRLWSWQRRLKLLWLVTLAYSLLLGVLRLPRQWIRATAALWLPQNRKAVPENSGTACQNTNRSGFLVGGRPTSLLLLHIFGMTHVSFG